MQLVIDIPQEEYKMIRQFLDIRPNKIHSLVMSIINGAPLPKGHGRLIDEKDLSLMTVYMIDGILVCAAPTIIEADVEESEDKE